MTTTDPHDEQRVADEVYRLTADRLSGEESAADFDRLERLLHDDPAARRLFVEFMQEADGIALWAGRRTLGRGERCCADVHAHFSPSLFYRRRSSTR